MYIYLGKSSPFLVVMTILVCLGMFIHWCIKKLIKFIKRIIDDHKYM